MANNHFIVRKGLAVNTADPQSSVHLNTRDAVLLPFGNNAQRPSNAQVGMVRYNTEIGHHERYDGSSWLKTGDFSNSVVANSSGFHTGNGTVNVVINSSSFKIGSDVVGNTLGLSVGANVVVNSKGLSAGNLTANTTRLQVGSVVVNAAGFFLGNVITNSAGFHVGSTNVRSSTITSNRATFGPTGVSEVGNTTDPVIALADNDTGFFRPGFNEIGVACAGNLIMHLLSGGAVRINTPPTGDNSNRVATTSMVQSAISPLAPIDSPNLTGVPTSVTRGQGSDSTHIATTAFVHTAVNALVTTGVDNSSYGLQGYVRFTDGLIIQWDRRLDPPNSPTFSWPITFPSACRFLIVIEREGGEWGTSWGIDSFNRFNYSLELPSSRDEIRVLGIGV